MTIQEHHEGRTRTVPFQLKGSVFTLTILQLRQTALAAIDTHLNEKISQAPDFFRNAPVIIDLEEISDQSDVDFVGLCELLRNRGMIPVAARNTSQAQQQHAAAAGLPVLPEGRAPLAATGAGVSSGSRSRTDAPPRPHHRIHQQPVRSGQQVYAANGDLIVLAPVSSGAEVLADGNIHIYGPLRGRALAGVKGDSEARIFCQQLEAELVSIAGNYRLLEEELEDAVRGKSAQIYLSEKQRLIIEPMSR
jgi:septum site-determining protein MinC